MRRRIIAIMSALLLAASIVSIDGVAQPQPSAAIGEPSFTNPLVNGADPWLQFYNGNYYLAATTWNGQVTMRKSPTLTGLKTAAETTVYSDTTPSRSTEMWAPEFHRLQGPNGWRWYLMYSMTGTSASNTSHRLYVLESATDDPLGPYTYKGQPLAINDWHIDGTYLTINGTLYMAWSQIVDNIQSMFISQMSNPWTAVGSPRPLSQPTQSWERIGLPVNEGPVAIQHNGKTSIVYSASFCDTADYKLGMLTLTGTDPLAQSSWQKSAGPIFQQANGVYGPGHNGFFTSPDGTQTWIVYHGNDAANQGCGLTRTTRTQPISWSTSNDPILGAPTATSTPITVPSGERGPITADVKGAPLEIVNRNSNLCLSVLNASTLDGADVVQDTCATSTTAKTSWVLDSTADGYYRIVNSLSHKVLDSVNCGTADGTDARQYAWLDNDCQQWKVTPTGDGFLTLQNRANGKLLEAANCQTTPGSDIRQWQALGNPCQQWSVRPSGDISITSFQSGKALELPYCTTAPGALAQQWQWLASPCQKWFTTPAEAGHVKLHPRSAPTLCLGVEQNGAVDGNAASQVTCDQVSTSWRIVPNPDGTTRLIARHSNRSLDLNNCALADGARLQQWTSLDNNCQKFRLAS